MPAFKDSNAVSLEAGTPVVEYSENIDTSEVEEKDEADRKGQSEKWTFWQEEVTGALQAEKRFREEGLEVENEVFGQEDKLYSHNDNMKKEDQSNIIHANVETLKPLIYSDTPEPIVRRRFQGDGAENDPTDRIAALAAERLARFIVHTGGLDDAMESARDDLLVPGRGQVRVLYNAEFEQQPIINPLTKQPFINQQTGQPYMQEVKTRETVKFRHCQWGRYLTAPINTWDEMPWQGFETPMTKRQITERFGPEIAERTQFPYSGMRGAQADADRKTGWEPEDAKESSGTPTLSSNNQCIVYEIWNRSDRTIIWWSPHYRDDILDEQADPLGLEHFWNTPKPLLAMTKNAMLIPRSDIVYYRARAREIDLATEKLSQILSMISVSGAYPGAKNDEVKKLLDGKGVLVAIEEWISFAESGGVDKLISWLPLEPMITAARALIEIREINKQALYEISGISDIVRGQSDPNETLGAQKLKGNYAGIRLRHKQRKVHLFARDAIHIAIELAVEHFDTETIRKIVNLDTVPATDAELEQMNAAVEQAKQQYAMMQQVAQLAQQQGMEPGPLPPPPEFPFYEQTSMERVHASLKDDMTRKFMLMIETDGTILEDMEEDKKQRIEFLTAFGSMAQNLFPMAASGIIPMKMMKELLVFAVRGFPKSRTLEGLIENLPDELPQSEGGEDSSVTVAQIRGEVDKMVAELKAQTDLTTTAMKVGADAIKAMSDKEESHKDREHDAIVKAADMAQKSSTEK